MQLPFAQIDAFADRPFTGNQAGVMPLDTWLDDDVLQAIAEENNLAETAFIVRDASGEADWELRWFTPTVEIALCGHATLASGHYLLTRDPALEQVRFRTRKAGILTVTREGGGLCAGAARLSGRARRYPRSARSAGRIARHGAASSQGL
jgi:PhzF family phenazine biosynthesis protein